MNRRKLNKKFKRERIFSTQIKQINLLLRVCEGRSSSLVSKKEGKHNSWVRFYNKNLIHFVEKGFAN
jgi:hypothetical protein